eukprot:351413-Chlamydomonas_euryale.AAC.4
MELDQFMNSKYLFKDVRNRPRAQQPPMPVTVSCRRPSEWARCMTDIRGGAEGGVDSELPCERWRETLRDTYRING